MARDIWGNRIEDSPNWPEIQQMLADDCLKGLSEVEEIDEG